MVRFQRASRPMMALPAVNKSLVSNQLRLYSRASKKLSKALESEIDYERENYRQIEDIPEFLEESGFKLTSNIENLDIVLSKEVGEKTIEIYFQARQPLADDEEMQAEEEEDPLSDNYCEFTAVVHNAGSASGLVADCLTMDTEISIHQVGYFQDLKKIMSRPRFER